MVIRPWNWNERTARLDLGQLAGWVDVTQPDLGIHNLQIGEQRLKASSLLGTSIGPAVTDEPANTVVAALTDAFVRGNDLIAKYDQTHQRPYRTEIYWTATPEGDSTDATAQLSLTVSIETDLLDSHPRIVVATTLPASEVSIVSDAEESEPVELPSSVKIDAGQTTDVAGVAVALFRFEQLGLSYAEMAHPSDFQGLAVRNMEGKAWSSRWQLFGQFLEKGVIRRARMRGFWIPRVGDIAAAVRAYREFKRSAIPLTA